jgi:xanthine dehydrogenase accessory factor
VERVLVRGVGDIGSAIAHHLFRAGYAVVLHDGPMPTTTRRGMAFADAVFEGQAVLDGVRAIRADTLEGVEAELARGDAIPIYVRPWGPLLTTLRCRILVDARMRKHGQAEVQRGYADFTIALGPALGAGRHADVVVETSWEGLGTALTEGTTLPLTGEPRALGGHARERYVYSPVEGVFRTNARIGDSVRKGQVIAEVGFTILEVPLDGVLRGLTHDGVPVTVGTKVIEVDPRGADAEVRGIGERPRRIADAVVVAIGEWSGHRAGEPGGTPHQPDVLADDPRRGRERSGGATH